MSRHLPPNDLPSHYQSCVSIFVPHLQKLKSDKQDAPWDEQGIWSPRASRRNFFNPIRAACSKKTDVELQENTVTLTSWLSE